MKQTFRRTLFQRILSVMVKYKNGNFVMLAKSFKRFMQNLGDDYFIEKYFQIPQYIEAINKLVEAGYKIGILIAPVILVENWKELYTEEEAATLKTYLREVVTNGTAYRLNQEKIFVYGKTGTAQISTPGKADSWFVGGIETNDGSKYAIAVVLENVNENTSPSIVVTKEIIKALDK